MKVKVRIETEKEIDCLKIKRSIVQGQMGMNIVEKCKKMNEGLRIIKDSIMDENSKTDRERRAVQG